MTLFHDVVKDEFKQVNQTILEQLYSEVPLINNIGQHIIGGGGKHLRPLMAILSALATNYSVKEQQQKHIQLATAVEFIHTATLLHDDVVDKSTMRRGKRTSNAIWGNSAAVLVGDFLYSRAFQLLTAIGNMPIMTEFALTTNSIAEGEVRQLVNIGKTDLTLDDYIDVINKKTAILFSVAMRSGSLLSTHNTSALTDSLGNYGLATGIAFQIYDDILDYVGNQNDIGKNLGDDLTEGKLTLPIIFALSHGTNTQQKTLAKIIDDKDVSKLTTVTEIIHDSNALEMTKKVALDYRDQAISNIAVLQESDYKQALIAISDFSIDRNN